MHKAFCLPVNVAFLEGDYVEGLRKDELNQAESLRSRAWHRAGQGEKPSKDVVLGKVSPWSHLWEECSGVCATQNTCPLLGREVISLCLLTSWRPLGREFIFPGRTASVFWGWFSGEGGGCESLATSHRGWGWSTGWLRWSGPGPHSICHRSGVWVQEREKV